jgi:hypothetical protein
MCGASSLIPSAFTKRGRYERSRSRAARALIAVGTAREGLEGLFSCRYRNHNSKSVKGTDILKEQSRADMT